MTLVAAHLRMTAETLRHTPTPDEHRRLLRDQAQLALSHPVQTWFHDSETGTLAAAAGRVPLIAGWPNTQKESKTADLQ